MAMRTDQEIIADYALSNTTLASEKDNVPLNYNNALLLEVLLNIREYLKDIYDKQEDILEKLNDIKELLEG